MHSKKILLGINILLTLLILWPVSDMVMTWSSGHGRPGILQALAAARHPDHVAEGGQDEPRHLGQGDGPVQVGIGRDAHRAARPGAEVHRLWQQAAQAIAQDSVGVPAAELHHSVTVCTMAAQVGILLVYRGLDPRIEHDGSSCHRKFLQEE